jgi:hypothetical protein
VVDPAVALRVDAQEAPIVWPADMRGRWSTVAVGVGIGMGLVVLSLYAGDEIGEWLRREFLQLKPYRMLVVAGAVGLGAAAVSFARARGASWPPGRRLAQTLRLRLIALPAGLVLPIIVGVGAALRISVNDAASMPVVFGDELIYTDLAKSFSETGRLVVRGVTDYGHSLLLPVLLSPVYALADDGAAAHAAVQVLNALAMALTAVPAYYLTRRVLTHGWSLGVALLSVLIPATGYSALVMTEALFYPCFVATALALTITLERPTLARQLVTAALVVALVAVRTQALAFVPAVASAVAIDGLRTRTLRRRLKTFWPTWLVLGLVGVLALVASRVGAEAPTGAYGSLLRTYNPIDVVKWAIWNTAGYELEVGVVAFAVLPLALTRMLRRDAPASERSLGATTLALAVWLLASVSVLSASPYGLDVMHQRSLFFVTPLVLVCFAYWLSDSMRRPLVLSLAVAAGVIGLAVALPSRLFLSAATVDAPANVLWLGLVDRITGVPIEWFVVGVAILGAAVFLQAGTTVLPLLSLIVTMLFVNANFVWRAPIARSETDRLAWIDRSLPAGDRAAIVHIAIDSTRCPGGTESYQGALVTWSEFFNKRVDRVYSVLAQVGNDGLQSPMLGIATDGTLFGDDGPIDARYVAVDSRIRIVGTELAKLDLHDFPGFDTAKPGSLTLWRTEGPVRLVFPEPLRRGRPEALACPS